MATRPPSSTFTPKTEQKREGAATGWRQVDAELQACGAHCFHVLMYLARSIWAVGYNSSSIPATTGTSCGAHQKRVNALLHLYSFGGTLVLHLTLHTHAHTLPSRIHWPALTQRRTSAALAAPLPLSISPSLPVCLHSSMSHLHLPSPGLANQTPNSRPFRDPRALQGGEPLLYIQHSTESPRLGEKVQYLDITHELAHYDLVLVLSSVSLVCVHFTSVYRQIGISTTQGDKIRETGCARVYLPCITQIGKESDAYASAADIQIDRHR
ncbi:hypothetical protein TgHK011_002826 [Trichoderma gracile]|nr:hypothetical protein TgHK011_002826 [Trichoderma gracile]